MKKFTKKLSILFASLAMVMGVGSANGSAKDVSADSSTVDIVSSGNLGADVTVSGNQAAGGSGYAGIYAGGYFKKSLTSVKSGSTISVSYAIGTYGGYKTDGSQDITVGAYNSDALVSETAIVSPSKKNTSATGDTGTTSFALNAGVTEFELRFISASSSTSSVYTRIYNLSITYEVEEVEIPTDASEIIALIDAIGTVEYTDECKAKIDAARAAYDAASDLQSAVSNYATLTAAEAEYARLEADAKEEADLEAALAFEDMIDALPEASEIKDLSKKEEINAAVEAYDKLTDDQKDLVNAGAVAKLEALKAALADLEPQIKYTLNTATDAIASNNSYTSYTGTDSNGTQWNVTCGAKQTDGLWLGVNSNNRSKAVLHSDNTKEVAIAAALGIDTNTAGWFGIVQEDTPMNDVGGITISYGKNTDDSTPKVAYILVSTDNGATYKVVDRHDMTKAAFNDGEEHVHIFAKNYKNALFAVMFDDTDGSSNTRLKAPKFDFYSYPNSTIADKFAELWGELRDENGSICNSLSNKANVQLLLDRYDELSEEAKAIVDETIDVEDVTIAESVIYVRNVINGDQSTTNDYGYGLTNTTIKMTGENNSTITLVALLALVGIISVSAYYFIEKKRLAK